MNNLVEWDAAKLKRFERVYQTAVKQNADSFWFERNEYLVSYAKYLIEYLKLKLK